MTNINTYHMVVLKNKKKKKHATYDCILQWIYLCIRWLHLNIA